MGTFALRSIEEAKSRRDAARRAIDVLSGSAGTALFDQALDNLEVALVAEICAWLDEVPKRMEEQAKRGATSLHPMYDAGQLAAVAQTAVMLRSGDWRRVFTKGKE